MKKVVADNVRSLLGIGPNERGATAALILSIASGVALAAPAERSRAAVDQFKREHPCPATGKSRGACPGWQVDHVVPLKCAGPDRPDNMQWLTVAEHKAKTAREARRCRTKH